MSWNKNTIVSSHIDVIVKTLTEVGEKYEVRELAKVDGMGLNDDWDTKYPIRMLSYRNIVVLERMNRHPDCDFDDFIDSHEFDKNYVPKEWEYDITDAGEDSVCYWEEGKGPKPLKVIL